MKKPILSAILFLVLLLLAGCASLDGKQTKLFSGAQLEFVSQRVSEPTVVFANGLDGHIELWQKVLSKVSKTNSIFTYNRPGVGKSDTTDNPRDAEQIVEELRSYLKELTIRPPYVLVGHSLGGLYMQLFARKYPSEVAGLVLVDSTHPLQMKGAGAPENWSWWIKFYFNLFLSKTGEAELAAINKSGEQVLSYSSKEIKFPIQILTATEPETASNEYEQDLIDKRKNMVQLYPNSKQHFIKGGHVIPIENPQAVVSAIQEILSQQQK
jgi:pimeloyl-ACP methyl ester carboxylesterase